MVIQSVKCRLQCRNRTSSPELKKKQSLPRINSDERGLQERAEFLEDPFPLLPPFLGVSRVSIFRLFFDQRSSAPICGKIFSSSPCLCVSVVGFYLFPILPDGSVLTRAQFRSCEKSVKDVSERFVSDVVELYT